MRSLAVRHLRRPALLVLSALVVCLCATLVRSHAQPAARPALDPGFQAAGAHLSPSARAGREIWFKATAGNGRFHTYVFQQRLGVLIDWDRVLGTGARAERFKTWGIINDPECCAPGSAGCPARSADETYGFDWCPGDQELLPFVGKAGYRDPACDFAEAPLDASDVHGGSDRRQSACDLEFGTSTGALGFRKFPNPRFDRARWIGMNGSPASWRGYNAPLASSGPDSRTSRLLDASVEPPFLIGMSCGACHIAFNPLKPPVDPANPAWDNIDGLVGNQYSRASEIMASGMSPNSLEWQVFAHARPGTVDTSAVPNDQINNPGTMNAIINLERRPTFEHSVIKWRKATTCAANADPRTCWCEPGKAGKCWERGQKTERVHHILKGGEDSIGTLEAIQRVYFNIGSCSEQCWVNHVTDLRQADPAHRGFGQTPFDIGQCRRDCPNFRAIEDRLGDIAAFLVTGRPVELYAARGLASPQALDAQLDADLGAGAVARGRAVFADNCARCHSSEPGPFSDRTDFRATVDGRPDLRKDFLSSDKMIPVTEVGTDQSRALHSNHVTGHVWQEYGSETLRAKTSVDIDGARPGQNSLTADGGRGYYRPISLLSVWAYAPFMHNNAIGPEVCGAPADPARELYRPPYVTPGTWDRVKTPPPCWPYDPSVDGRYKLFKASMEELLNPNRRVPKISLLDEPVIIDGPQFGGAEGLSFNLQIPAGVPAALIGNLRHKDLVRDLVWAKTNPDRLRAEYAKRYGPDEGQRIAATLQDLVRELAAGVAAGRPDMVREIGRGRIAFIQNLYSNSQADVENAGHTFGQGLSDRDKKALIAFLATL